MRSIFKRTWYVVHVELGVIVEEHLRPPCSLKVSISVGQMLHNLITQASPSSRLMHAFCVGNIIQYVLGSTYVSSRRRPERREEPPRKKLDCLTNCTFWVHLYYSSFHIPFHIRSTSNPKFSSCCADGYYGATT